MPPDPAPPNVASFLQERSGQTPERVIAGRRTRRSSCRTEASGERDQNGLNVLEWLHGALGPAQGDDTLCRGDGGHRQRSCGCHLHAAGREEVGEELRPGSKIAPVWSRSSSSFAATVTATTAQPAVRRECSRRPRQRARKRSMTTVAGCPRVASSAARPRSPDRSSAAWSSSVFPPGKWW